MLQWVMKGPHTMTRILMFGWEFPPHNSGGLGVACYGLTRSLAARGADITFVMPKKLAVGVPWAHFVFADLPEVRGVAVHSHASPYATSTTAWESLMRDTANAPAPLYGWSLMDDVLAYAATGADIARATPHDVIYAHDWLSFGAGIAAKRVSGKPLIAQVHATEFDRCGGSHGVNPAVYAIERAGMEMADAVIAVSEFTRQLIIREYGIPESKVFVVHNGIDEATTPQGAAMLGRLRALKRSGKKIVLFLGRITLQKGPDYFLKVARAVVARDPRALFVMAGSGDMETAMMRSAAELGIADKVIFTGFVGGADKHELYAAADLYVMPSVSEPFGITALEAMKTGTPVLLSKQSGVSEAVKHALKVDFWDIDAMTDKILAILAHESLGKALAANGAPEADKLTWDASAQKVDTVIQEALKNAVQ